MPRSKKNGAYSAPGAAKGRRSKKSGQSEFFVGYKKHTFWLVLKDAGRGARVIPWRTFVAPANVEDAAFVEAFVRGLSRKWHARLIIVGDMGYLDPALKARLRTAHRVTLLTRTRWNMLVPEGCDPSGAPLCPAGYGMRHWRYDSGNRRHIYLGQERSCAACGLRHTCPKEFLVSPERGEHHLGILPLHTRAAQRLLQEYRPVGEQGFVRDKRDLFLNRFYINSQNLAAILAHVCDACVLLQATDECQRAQGKKIKPLDTKLRLQPTFDFLKS